MAKKPTITNLIVVPLIASAIFLANPAFASSPIEAMRSEIRNVSSKENIPDTKKGIAGIVTSVSGTILRVKSENSTEYTVDATDATIMKDQEQLNENPALVQITDIKIGDIVMVRGIIDDTENG